MLFGIITEVLVGMICIIPGILLWKKQQVSILHDYHYRNVRKEDIPAYTRQMGSGLMITGAGIIITGVFDLFDSPFWWLPLLIGFILGLLVIYLAQKKYNGSIMG